jgi:hypothetical protein
MTEACVRELMKDKNFITNNGSFRVFHCTQGPVAVVRRDENVFRVVVHHPLQGWLGLERRIDFLNPIAAATYALRHCVTKREVKL